MKSEINELLASESAVLKLNPYCTLKRWTKIPVFDETTDALEVKFSFGVNADVPAKLIKSRDADGIVREVLSAQAEAVEVLRKKLDSDLKAGYIYGNKVERS